MDRSLAATRSASSVCADPQRCLRRIGILETRFRVLGGVSEALETGLRVLAGLLEVLPTRFRTLTGLSEVLPTHFRVVAGILDVCQHASGRSQAYWKFCQHASECSATYCKFSQCDCLLTKMSSRVGDDVFLFRETCGEATTSQQASVRP